ncbi:NUDIX domain-containing protein [Streptomyces viridiviolaceus]|uniref:NUDIX domain-containing protein n=2 Tax=Streptomyces viridiviolaceus TaxID=68282 RepID=A0ABW2E6N9_9ACTN
MQPIAAGLFRRAGTVYAAGCWHLPSGHLDGPQGDVVAALARETRGETGVLVDAADVRAVVTVHHRPPRRRCTGRFFFEARRWPGAPRVMEPAVCPRHGPARGCATACAAILSARASAVAWATATSSR